MRITPIQLETSNRLITDYRLAKDEIMQYFSYQPFESLEKRVIDLEKRSFKRQELSEILYKMNKNWDAPEQTLFQIDRLKDEKSVVVIGGQQAGLFTGPLYTINKIISVLTFAKNQEKKLNVPVIPVFWIAGEDHDYDEINHIFTLRNNKLSKHSSPQSLYLKQSIGHVEIEQAKLNDWMERAFIDLVETEHTKDIYKLFKDCLAASSTYVDFFARILFKLFPNEGIVLIDSANHDIRKLESEWFVQLIKRQPFISMAVYETVQTLQQKGYHVDLEVDRDDAHLFFHDTNNERILLKKENKLFVGKNDEISLTEEELLDVARENPARLSNNVVSRPMMQELLFPTLAFFGGDGEISYWAALKSAFSALDHNLQLPPVIPRLSLTYVTKRMSKLIELHALQMEYIINHGIEKEKTNWLMSQKSPPLDVLFTEVKKQIDEIHRPLRQLAKEISADLGETSEKNMEYIQKDITYLENKMKQKLIEKYKVQLEQFEEIQNSFKPNSSLQERIWNPLPFINEYGLNVFQRITDQVGNLSVEGKHYVMYLD